MWLVYAVCAAWAADDEGEVAVSEEVIVIDEAVERARAEVVREVKELGYTRVKEKDGRVVMHNEIAWKGKVVLYDDGRLETHRTGIRTRKVEPLPNSRVRPYFLCLINPTFCFQAGSWYVSPARWQATETKVVDATEESMRTWSDRLADQALAAKLEEVPPLLDALWATGAPIEGEATLATAAERRAALLDYWDTRTETAWGRQVREIVAGFVLAVVEGSDAPYTADEKAAFEARRRSAEPFPWPVDGP